jgi:hypothetical protein
VENPRIGTILKNITEALEFNEIKISRSWVQLIPKPNSVFSMKAEDIPNFHYKDPQNILPVVLIGIANYFFGNSNVLEYSSEELGLTTEKLYNFLDEFIKNLEKPAENDPNQSDKFYQLFLQYQKVSEQQKSNVYAYIDAVFAHLIEQSLIFVDNETGEYRPKPQFKDQINELLSNPYVTKFQELRQMSHNLPKKEEISNANNQ